MPPAIHLRQNQLHALYALEMIQFFEGQARCVLRPLARVFRGSPLEAHLEAFILEEARHSAMFAALNRRAAPDLYRRENSFFVRAPLGTPGCARALGAHPRWFPFWPWLMLVMEEKALFYARLHLQNADGLEPHFVAAQRDHIADEAHHIGWDEQLIEALWPATPLSWRRMNARLLAWLVREFFLAPKRGGVRLLAQLAAEFPAHGARLRDLAPALGALPRNPAWRLTVYSREMLPRARRLMERWPELAPLRAVLFGEDAPHA